MSQNATTELFAERLEELTELTKDKDHTKSDKKQASEIGIKYQTFRKYLYDNAECSIDNLVKIAKYYNVSADYLLGLPRDEAGRIMKDINKLKNYREKYKKHYNIDFGSDYVVHHIDENRQNNDIANLLLLPRELHSKYHTYKSQHMMIPFYPELSPSASISRNLYRMSYDELEKVLEETEEWVHRKYLMDMGYKDAYDIFKKYTKKGEK